MRTIGRLLGSLFVVALVVSLFSMTAIVTECSGLTTVYIPASLKYVFDDCFLADCGSIANIYYAGSKQEFESIGVVDHWDETGVWVA